MSDQPAQEGLAKLMEIDPVDLVENDPRLSIDFGPKGCVDARRRLFVNWELIAGIADFQPRFDGAYSRDEAAAVRRSCARADLYWVSPDMCGLVNIASRSIPSDSAMSAEMVPSRDGIAFLANQQFGISAIQWSVADDQISIEAYVKVRSATGLFPYMDWEPWPFGQTFSDDARPLVERYRSIIVTLFSLLSSPGVAETETEKPDNPSRKRAMRAGLPVDAVRVIYLRSRAVAGEHLDEESDRYHHRWIVSGHWRSQPYGPGRVSRRSIWILPHMKGPDGAPLLGGEKVRAVVR